MGRVGSSIYGSRRSSYTAIRRLLEVDLLRSGQHTVAAPYELLVERGRWDYLVCLHRPESPLQYHVWPMSIRDRLPRVRVPLLPPEPDVVLDLQAVLNGAYEDGAYARDTDYGGEPVPPLSPDNAAWVRDMLRDKNRQP